jgi:hypothetical protein
MYGTYGMKTDNVTATLAKRMDSRLCAATLKATVQCTWNIRGILIISEYLCKSATSKSTKGFEKDNGLGKEEEGGHHGYNKDRQSSHLSFQTSVPLETTSTPGRYRKGY